DWFAAVRAAGYTPGSYCSRLDAGRLLGPEFRLSRPVLWPFSIPVHTRAAWNDDTHVLEPPLPATWNVGKGSDTGWAVDQDTVGCQYDWFRRDRDMHGFHWPTATGASATGSDPGSFRDVDWDVAKVPARSHPRAAAVVTVAPDRGTPDALRMITVSTERLQYRDRSASGAVLAARDLNLAPGDIGPPPPASASGFDPA